MSYLLHNGGTVFIAYAVLMVIGTWAIGRALAATWRPLLQAIPYTILFAAAGRLIFWALSGGNNDDFLASFSQAYLDFIVLIGVAVAAYRLTKTRKMITQYPWLYQSAGPFSWRERNPSTGA